MATDLEDRLAALEQELAETRAQHVPKRRIRNVRKVARITIVFIGCLIILTGLGTGIWLYLDRQRGALTVSKDIRQAAAFTIYIPNALPGGYAQDAAATGMQSGIITYRLTSGTKAVLITQQALPRQEDLQLTSLQGFSAVKTPSGTAYEGKNGAAPTAIMQTPTTLITISGSSDTPSDVINGLASAMTPLTD